MSESNQQLAERPTSVKDYLSMPAYKARFGEVLSSRAPQFMASLINLSQDQNLARCEPRSVIASAMIAAVLDFPIEKSLGFCHIVAYGGVAQFQMAAKGYVQLALRSGQYQRLNAKPVNAEAFGGFDEVGEPRIDWGQLDETKPIIGYVVAWRLNNGFTKIAYWPKPKVEAHAAQFSQAYKARKMSSPWFTSFDKMALKTVVMNELRAWGVLSVQMQMAMKHDMGAQKDVEAEVEYVDSTVTEDTAATDANATVTPDPVAQRKPAPERSKKGAAAVVENKPATVEIAATPVPEKQQDQPAQPTTPPTEGKVFTQSSTAATKDVEPATPISRAFLKDGEEVTLSCTVAEVTPLMVNIGGQTKPSVKLELRGGYHGSAVHHGGGTGGPPPAPMGHEPIWEPGNAVKVKLAGKLQPKSGKVLVRVMEVTQEGQPVSPVEVVE